MLDAVEAKQHACQEHQSKSFRGCASEPAISRSRSFKRLDDPIDMREHHFFFAGEVEIDGAFADTGFRSDVFNGHFPIAKTGQKPVGGVQN